MAGVVYWHGVPVNHRAYPRPSAIGAHDQVEQFAAAITVADRHLLTVLFERRDGFADAQLRAGLDCGRLQDARELRPVDCNGCRQARVRALRGRRNGEGQPRAGAKPYFGIVHGHDASGAEALRARIAI